MADGRYASVSVGAGQGERAGSGLGQAAGRVDFQRTYADRSPRAAAAGEGDGRSDSVISRRGDDDASHDPPADQGVACGRRATTRQSPAREDDFRSADITGSSGDVEAALGDTRAGGTPQHREERGVEAVRIEGQSAVETGRA